MRRAAWLFVLTASLAAAAEEKPRVVFFRPDPCVVAGSEIDPCTAFDTILAHPAMQRRLRRFEFLTRKGDAAKIAVYDPSGDLAAEWKGIPPSAKLFTQMLNMVALAEPSLIDANRFAREGRRAAAERSMAVAALALGDVKRGRALLELVRESASEEDRALATIYLERLDAVESRRALNEAMLVQVASAEATPMVRFEAWMAVGDVRAENVRYAEAATAYGLAFEAATLPRDRELALSARQRVEEQLSGVIGLGPRGTAIAGRRTIVPRSPGPKAKKIEYRLDGKLVKTATQAPFTTTLNFGAIPTRQVLEITVIGAAAKVIQRRQIVVNERSDAFAIEILSPRRDAAVAGAVDVALAARVPQDRRIESVIVEWEGKRVARLTGPPFQTRIDVDKGKQGILRAVLRLDDGAEVEDARLLNAVGMTEESGAHLVELPVYFEGIPTATGLVIREDGAPRLIEQIIPATQTPLRIGLVFDASASMEEHMPDVQEAAIRFIEQNLDERDRAMVIGFDTTVRTLVRLTSDRALLERGVLALRPRGGTALYDALITTMLQLRVSGSRRALV
ncbi:MAG: VWA domain-containing protein, partial [Thermoanaerobaculia bacterium]